MLRLWSISSLIIFILLSGHCRAQGESEFSKSDGAQRAVVYHVLPHGIDEMENMIYASFLKKSILEAKKEQPKLFILEINTPGGELAATLKIEKLIRESGLPSVCFVNQNAISAGSLIALSCKKLVMAPSSRIGAATPVIMGKEGMKKAPEKILSASRAIWRSAAQAQGKNPDIAEAFVDEDVILTKAKHGISKPKGKLLTLTEKEAKKVKMLDYIAKDISEIIKKEKISNYELITLQPQFQDQILAFFLHPIVSGILMALGFLGILYELKAPGWGIAGGFGITFITIYFLSRILIGQSGWGAPALFGLGMLLLFLEFFVIPGFGIPGILGLVCVLIAMLWGYGISNLQEGMWVLASSLLGLSLGIFILLKYLPKVNMSPGRGGLFLSSTLLEGSLSVPGFDKALLGREGVCKTSLRPSGTIEVDDEPFDAISRGDFIESGQKVRIISFERYQVVVKKV